MRISGPGPIGDRFAVIDYDGDCPNGMDFGVFYKLIDYSDVKLLINGGMPLSQTDPRFHQQMVYAVASETLQRFEAALGRQIHWKLPDKAEHGAFLGARPVAGSNLFPHAMRQENAFYCREAQGILFGYFKANRINPGRNLPGQTVFTCLSHDIIAHEITHAIVDGIRQYFIEADLSRHAGFPRGLRRYRRAFFAFFTQGRAARHAAKDGRPVSSNCS